MLREDESALRAEEERLRGRMVALVDAARRELRRRLREVDPESETAAVLVEMIRATEDATTRLQGGLTRAMGASRRRVWALGRQLALESLPEGEAEVPYRLSRALVERTAGYHATLIRGLCVEARDEVTRRIQVAMLSGQPMRELEQDLGLHVREAIGPFRTAAKRCEAIAVTETNRVANLSIFDRGMAARQRHPGLEKEWVTASDGRVRTSHYRLNGVRVAMGATFDVGGYAGLHPLDPNLPASESVRCRCRVVFVVGEDGKASDG